MPDIRRDKAILAAGLISDRVGLALLYIVFAPLARGLGLSELQFGLLIASANVTLGFASPYWGRRSQVAGRRPVFVTGLTGYAIGFLLLAITLQAGIAGLLGHWPLFFTLLAVRIGYGLFAAGTQPAATAYLADITDTRARSGGMALMGVAAGVGTLLGPVIGGGLSPLGAVVPLYAASGLAALAAIAAHAGLREPARRVVAGSTGRLSVTDPRIFPYLVGWCVAVFVLTAVQTIAAFYIEDRFFPAEGRPVTRTVSAAFLVMGIAMVLVQGVVMQAIRLSAAHLLRAGFLLFGLALLLLVVARDVALLYVAFGVLGLGFGALGPGLNAAATLQVAPGEQGTAAGLLAAAPVLGMIAGPLAGTALYAVRPDLLLLLGAAGCAALAVYFFRQR